MKLTFVTGNQAKADLMSQYLEEGIDHIKLDLTEIQTLDAEEVVRHKVMEAYLIVKKPVLVEDTSVVFQALGRLPGPFIKFFTHELTNAGICQLMRPYKNKSAIASINFGYYDGKEVTIFTETLKGRVADEPKGTGGMGWDPIFIPEGHDKTRAELSNEDYDVTSPRRKAVERIKEFLKEKENAE